MEFLTSIVPTLIVLGLLIVIHEFGHFLACRLTGVRVEKFSVGFGPEIIHWQGKETRYAISLLPLGGYVKPAGESAEEIEEHGAHKGDYLTAPLLARIFIVVSGVIMNYFLAFTLFVLIGIIGRPVPGTAIGGFVDGYPAATSGLAVGDRITAVNGQPVMDWNELTILFNKAPDGPLDLTVDRHGHEVDVQILPESKEGKDLFGEKISYKRIGIKHAEKDFRTQYLSFGESVRQAWKTTVFIAVVTHKAIWFLVQGKLSMEMISGPVGIIAITGSAARMGLPYLLQIAANLSVSLAVINLLPIPALDGGHLLFLILEGIRRKPVSLKFQERATRIGFAALLVLMVYVIYNDLVKLEVVDKVSQFFGGGG